MKKLKFLLLGVVLLLTGCFNNDSMDNINITTTVYPIEFIVKTLYGNHSTISSIYPKDTEVSEFQITDVLLKQYSNTDLYVFNGLTEEKNYISNLRENNSKLKIIDVTSSIDYTYSIEELWLDPNNLLTIANNIKKGFNEYIKSSYLKNEINKNYEQLKVDLTNLDGKYYSTIKKANNKAIVVSSNAFKYLEKYGLEVISLDPETVKDKDIELAKIALSVNNYVFIEYNEEINEILDSVIDEDTQRITLYTLTDLNGINLDKEDYFVLLNENLENLIQAIYE